MENWRLMSKCLLSRLSTWMAHRYVMKAAAPAHKSATSAVVFAGIQAADGVKRIALEFMKNRG